MQVFKVYFKVIRKNLPMLSIYVAVFIGIAFAFSAIGGGTAAVADFTETRCAVAVFNEDGGAGIALGLERFIEEHANRVELEDASDAIQDALFFRKAEYILRIPAGFSEALMAGEEPKLVKNAVPDSTAAVYMDMLIGDYLNAVRLYAKGIGGVTQEEIAGYAAQDAAVETAVTVRSGTGDLSSHFSIASFFNASAYTILAVLILSVSAFTLVLNKPDLRRRNLCSPISPRSINIQSLLGNLVFALVLYALICACAFVLHGGEVLTLNGLLWFVNLLVFLVVALCLSYLLASLIRNRNAQNAAANTVALGMSFLCGVFVPQSLLSGTVNSIAQFLPAYWFVRANYAIAGIAAFNWENLSPILAWFAVQLGFAALFLAVTFIVTGQRKNRPERTAAVTGDG